MLQQQQPWTVNDGRGVWYNLRLARGSNPSVMRRIGQGKPQQTIVGQLKIEAFPVRKADGHPEQTLIRTLRDLRIAVLRFSKVAVLD